MTGRTLTCEQKKRFEAQLRERGNWYLRGRRQWSFAYHFTIFASATLSAVAAVMLQLQKLDIPFREDLASILAGLAAVLIAVNTAGGFSRKWQANRRSRDKIETLQNELIARDPTPEDIERLNKLIVEHSAAITGA
jgi:hypothetical protein